MTSIQELVAHVMRTPMGELAFAAHSRHAQPEMLALAEDVLIRAGCNNSTSSLTTLLAPYPHR